MNKKNQEPKPKFGFYAVIPRIVRTQYKKLSHAEKWLYVCLKDLCGDKGTCFRTLRALSEETDVSTGSLSKMIPNLHKHGLIHAEKKRRTESGKEVWHITIADVWAENAKACSKNEQSKPEVVQNTNNEVQKMNEKSEDGSKNERDCSNFVDRRKNTEEVTIIEERTREESAFSPSLSSQKNKEEETKTLEVDYSLFDDLCRKKGYAADFKVSRNEKSDSAIQELRSQGATPEQVAYVFNDIWDDKDPFWKQHRGKPSTVASQFTARVWKMSQSAPTAKRRSVSGFTNYTEDKTAGAPTPRPARVVPEEQEKPKEPSLPVGYTRMQFNDPKPARARSLQARLQQAKEQ